MAIKSINQKSTAINMLSYYHFNCIVESQQFDRYKTEIDNNTSSILSKDAASTSSTASTAIFWSR